MSERELEGRVVVVTGGARGAGRAIAERAAAAGARVVVADLDVEGTHETVARVTDAGGSARGIRVDVSDPDSFAAAFAVAENEWGRVDGLVNNAGLMVVGSIDETSVEGFDRAMAVNARGAFIGAKLAVEHFRRHGDGGAIVNITSISGEVGLPGQVAYCASKGAVKMLTKQLAVDLASEGIRCNAVSPGSIGGEFLDDYLGGLPDPTQARTDIVAAHPIARVADPVEIADPVVFLLSDRSSFITGAVLAADGGYTAR
ncbi:SDR family NAD(P)-dependent oxidoreductase [Microbacterium atlanticum]|uniref:SDR family NAD(P)-dependent oxidoreductase n=1 Tax=Microbacterium atlanticum TaxID=2782168 RepID=UPI001886BF63|nr:SDR family oxidoreductase [Microbacterium atlanticum]